MLVNLCPKKKSNLLSNTARNLLRFVQAFGIKLKLRSFVNMWMVEDRVQDLHSDICGIFQLYFYDNLFNPKESSIIQDNRKLTKKTVETLLNELFSLDDQPSNEQKMRPKLGLQFTSSFLL